MNPPAGRHLAVLLPLSISLGLHAGLIGGLVRWGGAGTASRVQPLSTPPTGHAPISGISVIGTRSRAPVAHPRSALFEPNEEKVETALLPLGDSSSGPAGPSGEAIAAYGARIRELIGQKLHYPLSLRRRGVEGRVGLRIELNPLRVATGELVTVSEPSGSSELDALALEAARAAQPFPAPETTSGALPPVLNLPIEFRLKSR